jgi:hypothetical protein
LDKIDHVDIVKDLINAEANGLLGHILALSSIIWALRQVGSADELVLQEVPALDQLLESS